MYLSSEHYTISIISIIVASLMPIALAGAAKRLGGFTRNDNRDPRTFLAHTTSTAKRCHAAQINSFEILPFFISAVICAIIFGVAPSLVNTLAAAFILLRIGYAYTYITDRPTVRSIVWTLATACPLTLFILCLCPPCRQHIKNRNIFIKKPRQIHSHCCTTSYTKAYYAF